MKLSNTRILIKYERNYERKDSYDLISFNQIFNKGLNLILL